MTNAKLEAGQHTVRLNLHLSERMKKIIERLAKSWGVSANEAARQLIESSPYFSRIEHEDFLAKPRKA